MTTTCTSLIISAFAGNTKSVLSTSIMLAWSCLALFAQNASIEGIIRQTDSTSAIPGITVYLEKTRLGGITNGNGYYSIKKVPAGGYTIVVAAIGYFTLKEEISVKPGEALKLDFTIVEAVSTLSEVTIMTGGNTGLKDIPGSVHYISPKEIQQFNYTDVNRTLRTVPGVNIQEEDGFGLRPNIGLRGTGVERSSKITLMEDGVLMAPAPYAAPAAYYFPTVGRMQGVEILKGSSQIKYGPYTTGGAINLISTQIPAEFEGRINLLAGSLGSKNLHAFVGESQKNFGYLVETFQYNSNGFKQLDNGGDTGFDKKDYLAKIRVNTNGEAKIYQSLTFKIGQTFENSNETYLGLTQADFYADPFRRYAASQMDHMKTKQNQFALTHVALFPKLLDLTTTAYRTEFKRNWYKIDKVKNSSGTQADINALLDNPAGFGDAYAILTGLSSSHADALFVKANNRSYYAQGIQTILGLKFNTNRTVHELDLGLRVHKDQMDRFQWVDEYTMDNGLMELTRAGAPGTESNRVETAWATASYLQYKLRIRKFTATPGIRYEHIRLQKQDYGKNDPERTGTDRSVGNNTVDVFIPGIGLDYQFSKYLSTFAGIHKGFAPPGTQDETESESSVNYELGMRFAKYALSSQAVFFFNNYSNLLGADLAASGGGGTNQLFNGGKVQAMGLEIQLIYDLLAAQEHSAFSLPLSLAYTYTNAVFKNSFDSDFEGWGKVAAGDHIPYLASNQLSLVLGLEHRKFNINLSGRYTDAMRTAPGQGDIAAYEKTDACFILDASASYLLHKNASLFANATNLGNQVYVVARRPAGLRPGLPRAVNVGLKATF